MNLSSQADQIGASLSQKATLLGTGTSGASFAAAKAQTMGILSMEGPEVVNFCALAGVGIAFLGFLSSLYFQWRRDKHMRQSRPNLNAGDE